MQKNVAKFMFQIKLSTILAPHTGHFTMKVLRNEQAMQYRFGRNAATGAFSNEPELKNLFFFFFTMVQNGSLSKNMLLSTKL